MIALFSLRNLYRPATSRAADVVRLVRTLEGFRRSRRRLAARAERDLFFRDSQLVSGWGFAPVASSTRRTRAHS